MGEARARGTRAERLARAQELGRPPAPRGNDGRIWVRQCLCARAGCAVAFRVPDSDPHRLMCDAHWRRVPLELRAQLQIARGPRFKLVAQTAILAALDQGAKA